MRWQSCQIKLTQCGGDPVYFDYNRHNVKRKERTKLNDVAECLKGDNVAPMTIEGHCDERGMKNNMALGERRAEAAKKYLSLQGRSGRQDVDHQLRQEPSCRRWKQ